MASPLHANLILPLHNRAGKGEHPAKCFLTCRNVEIELIFMRQRRAVFSREEKAVRPDAEVFELPRRGAWGPLPPGLARDEKKISGPVDFVPPRTSIRAIRPQTANLGIQSRRLR